ncbi:TetR/AcrR family transcriptional regulator [Nocardia sp. CDC160]|uniref:TetR/AcrR family transcriptional regulator n=1 Tax=Nocardia sp. CDC160 TaxID=3112166 RepID=UPI002DBAB9D3|nr:TetR/AcrR family transcriptional regulator [Nocardia sp. CDC160]MEC3918397.1 TetR/AcrR family transcriptional regulator [Nocardia sp. CDC160]MEC3919134.1 TetR/AcrR family transcriptional regulator [Nocardia sp. CDC160]
MTQPQNARGHRTVGALLAATRDIIENDGLPALTMAAVAERAGVTRRAVYLHFATRTDLVTALYRSLGETDNLAESLQAVWDAPDAVSGLREWVAHLVRSHLRILAVLRAFEQAQHTDPDAAALWRTTQGNWLKGSRRVVERLAREGVLAPHLSVDTATDLLWSLMSLDLLDRLAHQRRWSNKRLTEQLTAMYFATFVAPS